MFEEESEPVLSSDDIDEAIRQSQNHSTIIHTQSVYIYQNTRVKFPTKWKMRDDSKRRHNTVMERESITPILIVNRGRSRIS